jgi:hypothetical protein
MEGLEACVLSISAGLRVRLVPNASPWFQNSRDDTKKSTTKASLPLILRHIGPFGNTELRPPSLREPTVQVFRMEVEISDYKVDISSD